MKLNHHQISKIKQEIKIDKFKSIVRIDVSEDKNISPNESSSNIYCINENKEIIWQVKEIKLEIPFNDDMFVYLERNEKGEILANRFSGFEYKINPETGEAEQIGFHK